MPKSTKVGEDIPVEVSPSIHFDFPKDSKKLSAPDNMEDIKVDEEATVIVTGIIRGVSHDNYGRSFRIEPGKVKIKVKEEGAKSLQEALNENSKKRVVE